MSKAISNINRRRLLTLAPSQRGVSLVELMVGLVIGLVLVLAASAVYLFSKNSFNYATEISQLEENGRFAINLLTKHIQSAGFVMIDPTAQSPQGPIDNKITGCDLGITVSTSAVVCKTTTPTGQTPSASLGIFSETDAPDIGTKFQGFDCLGGPAVAVVVGGKTTYQTRSYFYITRSTVQTPGGSTTMGQLSCVADRSTGGVANFVSDTIFPGIEQLSLRYLLPSAADPNTAQSSNLADGLTAAQWGTVLAVDVCVLAKTIQAGGNDSGTSYTDCYGNAITATSGESYKTFQTTVRLRNKSGV